MLKQEDYFALNNGYLTRSKISDYRKCPNYFKRKHLDGAIKDKSKKHFLYGSLVDELICQIDNKSNYVVTDKKFNSNANKAWKLEQEALGKIVVRQEEYENIFGAAIAVEETEAYQFLNSYPRQVLLQCEYPFKNGLFKGLAALPDFAKITPTSADLCDLKTANNFRLDKWRYVARDHGYFLQFALQTLILRTQGITEFTYRHLVVSKEENINNVYAILIDPQFVEDEMEYLQETIEAISNDKHFRKRPVNWCEPYYLEKNLNSDDELFEI